MLALDDNLPASISVVPDHKSAPNVSQVVAFLRHLKLKDTRSPGVTSTEPAAGPSHVPTHPFPDSLLSQVDWALPRPLPTPSPQHPT